MIKKILLKNNKFSHVLRYFKTHNLGRRNYFSYSKITNVTPWNIKKYLKRKAFYSQFIKKDDLCFDIGANLGEHIQYFLCSGANVIAVEPQGRCLTILNQRYGKDKKLKIVGKAVGEEKKKKEFYLCDEISTLSTFSDKWKTEGRFSTKYHWSKNQKVEMITLDQLILEFGKPKFCKIDVEGYELNVLKGLTTKIPYLSFEFTREFFEDAKKCINYLMSLGNVKFNFVAINPFEFFLSNWVLPELLYNAIDSIDNEFLNGDIYAKMSDCQE